MRLIAAVLWLAICLPLWAIWRLFGAERIWVRRFLGGIGWLLGLRLERRGRPAAPPALLVANHVSWLDILALGGMSDVCFVAKSEIDRWPLIGWLSRIGGTIFVSRDRRADTRNQADIVAAALLAGRTVVLFAEGGTGDGITIQPFRPPLFVSAIEAGARVQPVAIDYGRARATLAWPSDMGFGGVAKRMLNQKGAIPAKIKYLAPLDSQRFDRKALALRSHAAILSSLD